MKIKLSFISIIAIVIAGLLLFTSCILPSAVENTKEETAGSVKPAAKAEEDIENTGEEGQKDAAAETEAPTIEENTGQDESPAIEEDTGQDSGTQVDSAGGQEEEAVYVNDFTLMDLDKNEVSLSDFQGKIVILNFWATWCPPCREEIPDFIEVNNLYKDKNVQLIGVSVDTDIKALDDFVKEFGINYLTLIDGTVDTISPIWGVRAIPTTFILDKNGGVMFENVGMMTKDQLVKILEEVL